MTIQYIPPVFQRIDHCEGLLLDSLSTGLRFGELVRDARHHPTRAVGMKIGQSSADAKNASIRANN